MTMSRPDKQGQHRQKNGRAGHGDAAEPYGQLVFQFAEIAFGHQRGVHKLAQRVRLDAGLRFRRQTPRPRASARIRGGRP